MEIPFVKYQGTGNDFVMINAFQNSDIISSFDMPLVKRMCDRHFGVGADGLIILAPDDELEFKMVYFNSDGALSSMCGNGGRCLAHFAHKLGIVGSTMRFKAIDGEHEAVIDDQVSLKMMDVLSYSKSADDYIIDTGSPHYVRFVNSLEMDDFIQKAREIRYSEAYNEEGINVNFVVLRDGSVNMRTYERGVEDETLSCGTGVVAASLASFLKSGEQISSPIHVLAPGGNLSVEFKYDAGQFTNIWLKGPATEVFSGRFSV